MRRVLITPFVVLLTFAAFAQTAKERHFIFHYTFTVRNVSPDERLRVWIPMAHSDTYQTVRVLSKSGDLPLQAKQEQNYGNWMFYAEAAKPKQKEYHFAVDYDVTRREEQVPIDGRPNAGAKPAHVQLARFLQPDHLVPVDGVPAQLAAEQTKGATTPLEKARAMYDYVFKTMKYDKSGTGWGHGDVLWACDSKRGNCTDFHSLFIAMARSQHIPARFDIGSPLPADKSSGDIAGYHCWADFYLDSTGWVPVDISEAWKHPELHDYYFGQRDPHRVQFTIGRDLRLEPAQSGPALNYFVYPYVEVGGKEYSNVAIAFSFEDAQAVERKSGGSQ